MHDIRAIRENPAAFDAALARRGLPAMSANILALDETRRARIHAAETAQAEQNKASKEVGAAKAKGDEAEFERLRALVASADGDGRFLLNQAETLYAANLEETLDATSLGKLLQRRVAVYDKDRDGHYGLISALHKALRGSEGASHSKA